MGLFDHFGKQRKEMEISDPRYSASAQLKFHDTKNVRGTFTFYKNDRDTDIEKLKSAYGMSDHRVALGEVLNKMVDIITTIIDDHDGRFDFEDDYVYAWQYARVLKSIADDKVAARETLTSFDNRFRNAVATSETMARRYPGKYTLATDYTQSRNALAVAHDLSETFDKEVIPRLNEAALKQSQTDLGAKMNRTLGKLKLWAEEREGINTYYESKPLINEATDIYYSLQTVILFLPNGYEISVVGTFHGVDDNTFSIAVFDTSKGEIVGDVANGDVKKLQAIYSEVKARPAVATVYELSEKEKIKADVYGQYAETLKPVKAVIRKEYLEKEHAGAIVGEEYIKNALELYSNGTAGDSDIAEIDSRYKDMLKAEVEKINGLIYTPPEGQGRTVPATDSAGSQEVHGTLEEAVQETAGDGGQEEPAQAPVLPAAAAVADGAPTLPENAGGGSTSGSFADFAAEEREDAAPVVSAPVIPSLIPVAAQVPEPSEDGDSGVVVLAGAGIPAVEEEAPVQLDTDADFSDLFE